MIDPGKPVVIPTLAVQIETAGTCNAACSFCPYPSLAKGRVGKLMTRELFHKIVDEVATIPVVSEIKLVGLNEPLLDYRLEEFIAYIRAVSPSMRIGIYTNGLLLTSVRHESLRTAGLTNLIVSLNAVRSEQHEQITGIRGKFETICRNVDYARRFDRPRLQVHAVYTYDTFTETDKDEFYSRWGDARKDGNGLVICEANWGGELELPARAVGLSFANTCCFRAISQFYVTFDGKVTTCCMDPVGRQVFGDLNTQTIREVYNGELYLNFRRAHSEDRADEYPTCRSCTRV